MASPTEKARRYQGKVQRRKKEKRERKISNKILWREVVNSVTQKGSKSIFQFIKDRNGELIRGEEVAIRWKDIQMI